MGVDLGLVRWKDWGRLVLAHRWVEGEEKDISAGAYIG